MLNTLDGVRDETGASPTPWAIWTRAWTAKENRHGDLLNKYLYLTGRVDMKAIEKTGSWDREQPLPWFHLHLLPGTCYLHFPWQHCPVGQAAWRSKSSSSMRNHCCRREAPRDCLYQNCGEAIRDRSGWHSSCFCQYDEEEDIYACPSDVRWTRFQSVRALLSCCPEAWDLHGQGLR